jgi:hypothetical protein
MLEICIQTSYDQNVELILKSYLPVVYGTTLIWTLFLDIFSSSVFCIMSRMNMILKIRVIIWIKGN